LSTDAVNSPADQNKAAASSRRKGFGLFAVLVLVAVLLTAWWLWSVRNQLVTDNAYVSADVARVAAMTEGTVKSLSVHAGQQVKVGEVLAELDDADAQIALAQAEAGLAKAVRDTRGLGSNALAAQSAVAQHVADIASAQAQLQGAEAELTKAHSLLARQQALVERGFISQETLVEQRAAVKSAQGVRDAAASGVRAAEASAAQSRAALSGALAQVDGRALASLPDVLKAMADVRQASLSLVRLRLLAPVDGVATARSAQLGDRLDEGSSVVSIVPLHAVWVDANFKETELKRLRVGQPVTLTADVYGSSVSYQGRVAGIEPATGTSLSLLPAQNASGNWIKVVQRVPVRIWLDSDALNEHPLQVGLSMKVKVDVSNQDGARLGLLSEAALSQSTDIYARMQSEAEAQAAQIIARNITQVLKQETGAGQGFGRTP
jgi:membrane fusion protein (multidrug efflux system)